MTVQASLTPPTPYPPLEDHKYQLDRHHVPSLTRPVLSQLTLFVLLASSVRLSPFLALALVAWLFTAFRLADTLPKEVAISFGLEVRRLQFSGGNQVELNAGGSSQRAAARAQSTEKSAACKTTSRRTATQRSWLSKLFPQSQMHHQHRPGLMTV